MRKLLTAAVAAAALQAAVPAAMAADSGFTLTPYLWAIGIDGDVKARGTDANVSMDFEDVVDNLDMAGSVLLEGNVGNWVSYAMVDYMAWIPVMSIPASRAATPIWSWTPRWPPWPPVIAST